MNYSLGQPAGYSFWVTVSPGKPIDGGITCDAMDCKNFATTVKTVEAETNTRYVGRQEVYVCDEHKPVAGDICDWSDWE